MDDQEPDAASPSPADTSEVIASRSAFREGQDAYKEDRFSTAIEYFDKVKEPKDLVVRAVALTASAHLRLKQPELVVERLDALDINIKANAVLSPKMLAALYALHRIRDAQPYAAAVEKHKKSSTGDLLNAIRARAASGKGRFCHPLVKRLDQMGKPGEAVRAAMVAALTFGRHELCESLVPEMRAQALEFPLIVRVALSEVMDGWPAPTIEDRQRIIAKTATTVFDAHPDLLDAVDLTKTLHRFGLDDFEEDMRERQNDLMKDMPALVMPTDERDLSKRRTIPKSLQARLELMADFLGIEEDRDTWYQIVAGNREQARKIGLSLRNNPKALPKLIELNDLSVVENSKLQRISQNGKSALIVSTHTGFIQASVTIPEKYPNTLFYSIRAAESDDDMPTGASRIVAISHKSSPMEVTRELIGIAKKGAMIATSADVSLQGAETAFEYGGFILNLSPGPANLSRLLKIPNFWAAAGLRNGKLVTELAELPIQEPGESIADYRHRWFTAYVEFTIDLARADPRNVHIMGSLRRKQ